MKLYRSVMETDLWQDKPFTRGQAWVDLIMLANHMDKEFLFDSTYISVERGSFITSKRKLSERWGWSITKLTKFLNELEKVEMLAQNSDTKKTTLKILNYEKYQGFETILEVAEKTGKRTAKEHRKNTERTPKETNNKEKNDKNEKKVRMGTHQHIKIEPVGFDQLVNDFGKPVIDEYVERLDRYIEETGRYKNANHAGIIRRWITEDAARSKKKPGNNKFNNFHQRAYDYSELERQLLGK